MRIPNNAQCIRIVEECTDFLDELNEFEHSFITSNVTRKEFSDKQKEVLARMADKYNIKAFN